MRSPRVLVGWPVLIVLLFPCAAFSTDTPNGTASPSIAAQPNDRNAPRIPAGQPVGGASRSTPGRQPGESTMLEITPQPSAKVPAPDKLETKEQREFRQAREAEIAKLNRNFHPHDPEEGHHRPYLGIELEYTTQCYLGMEEHGFEVVSVNPDSPAARAGMIGRTASTAKGELGAIGSVLLLPIAPITFPYLRKSGALGTPGDLIVAVDDVRVRTVEQIRYALDRLKPGDTAYLTVIRPLAGGYHRTMRIKLHIDQEIDAKGKIVPAPSAAPSVTTESEAN
jgi:hypothetical protein